jgi:DNA-binding transcriptional LysR family regulator
VTLLQLRVFVAAARLGSFTAAALALHLAQPTVSEIIRRLEDGYGIALFIRTGRRLLLTPAAEELLPLAEKALASAEEAERALKAVNSLDGGIATFGLLRNANYYSMADLLGNFHARYPKVRLRVVGLNSVEVANMVRSGELEGGIVVLPLDPEGLTFTPLRRDEVLYASANPEHVAAPVTIEELATRDLVLYDAHYGWKDPTRRQLAERAQLAGVTVEARIEVEQSEAALTLVASGAGDTFVSRAVAQHGNYPPGISFTSFDPPLYDTIALVQREGGVLSPATAELSRLARAMLAEEESPEV